MCGGWRGKEEENETGEYATKNKKKAKDGGGGEKKMANENY